VKLNATCFSILLLNTIQKMNMFWGYLMKCSLSLSLSLSPPSVWFRGPQTLPWICYFFLPRGRQGPCIRCKWSLTRQQLSNSLTHPLSIHQISSLAPCFLMKIHFLSVERNYILWLSSTHKRTLIHVYTLLGEKFKYLLSGNWLCTV